MIISNISITVFLILLPNPISVAELVMEACRLNAVQVVWERSSGAPEM